METKRVPDLGWPKDLFGGRTTDGVIDDLDNPFLEACDFAPNAQRIVPAGRAARRDLTMGMCTN